MTEAVSAAQHHHPLASLWPGFQDVQAWGVLLAVAASGAGAAALQSRGQSRITASRAQVTVWQSVHAVGRGLRPGGPPLGLLRTPAPLAVSPGLRSWSKCGRYSLHARHHVRTLILN